MSEDDGWCLLWLSLVFIFRIHAYSLMRHILIYPSTISRSVDGYLIEDGVAVAVIGFENGFVLEGAV